MSGKGVGNSSLDVIEVEGINERHRVGTVRDVNGPHGGGSIYHLNRECKRNCGLIGLRHHRPESVNRPELPRLPCRNEKVCQFQEVCSPS
jgi:hypothetical protein